MVRRHRWPQLNGTPCTATDGRRSIFQGGGREAAHWWFYCDSITHLGDSRLTVSLPLFSVLGTSTLLLIILCVMRKRLKLMQQQRSNRWLEQSLLRYQDGSLATLLKLTADKKHHLFLSHGTYPCWGSNLGLAGSSSPHPPSLSSRSPVPGLSPALSPLFFSLLSLTSPRFEHLPVVAA